MHLGIPGCHERLGSRKVDIHFIRFNRKKVHFVKLLMYLVLAAQILVVFVKSKSIIHCNGWVGGGNPHPVGGSRPQTPGEMPCDILVIVWLSSPTPYIDRPENASELIFRCSFAHYYRCNNYVASKVSFFVNAWAWRHWHSHINCLITQGST